MQNWLIILLATTAGVLLAIGYGLIWHRALTHKCKKMLYIACILTLTIFGIPLAYYVNQRWEKNHFKKLHDQWVKYQQETMDIELENEFNDDEDEDNYGRYFRKWFS